MLTGVFGIQKKKYLLPKLIAKPIRSASGIAVVAVM
jgi:histone acetyltransferase (RNA polymerase elongator complex component)